MPTQLLSLADGPNILLDKPILLFGRHEECDIQLNSKKVSRRHCVVAHIGDYLVVRDLGSTNGVKINGQRVVEGKLHPGDELQIGNFKYQVCGEVVGPANDDQAVPATEREAPPPGSPEASSRRWSNDDDFPAD
ncbi:MAG: FHA domain-containing protein [Gemmataceae bacterium]|nr:FHA domain-containing protein [Gemmata sp.]MDW8198445.1 FHA domain-containing protein [Gemmataceae bacterium]